MKNIPILTFLVLILAACTTIQSSSDINEIEQGPPPLAEDKAPDCDLQPITVPTLPEVIPGYTQLDETTGLHVTGEPPEIDFFSYRLLVTGLVENPISITYDQLRCLPKVTDNPVLVCPGSFEDNATWSGVLMSDVLALAQPLPEAKKVSMISADGYSFDISLAFAMDGENFLAYEWEGQPLPILHGFPLRAVLPSREGYFWVKWIVELNVK